MFEKNIRKFHENIFNCFHREQYVDDSDQCGSVTIDRDHVTRIIPSLLLILKYRFNTTLPQYIYIYIIGRIFIETNNVQWLIKDNLNTRNRCHKRGKIAMSQQRDNLLSKNQSAPFVSFPPISSSIAFERLWLLWLNEKYITNISSTYF